MSTAQVIPDSIPTDAEIVDDIRAVIPGLKLYRPSPDWWALEFAGRNLWMPPELPGEPMVPHPTEKKDGRPLMVKANGTLEVRDRYGPQLDEKTKKPAGFGPAKGEDALSQAKHALRKHQQHGVTLLRGDASDEQRKKKALAMFMQHQRTWAEAQVAAYAKRRENFKKQDKNKGLAVPQASPRQKLAQEILDELMEQGSKTFKYACENRCYSTNDLEKFERHLRVRHPEEFRLWQADNSEESAGAVRGKDGVEKLAGAIGKPQGKKKAGAKKKA